MSEPRPCKSVTGDENSIEMKASGIDQRSVRRRTSNSSDEQYSFAPYQWLKIELKDAAEAGHLLELQDVREHLKEHVNKQTDHQDQIFNTTTSAVKTWIESEIPDLFDVVEINAENQKKELLIPKQFSYSSLTRIVCNTNKRQPNPPPCHPKIYKPGDISVNFVHTAQQLHHDIRESSNSMEVPKGLETFLHLLCKGEFQSGSCVEGINTIGLNIIEEFEKHENKAGKCLRTKENQTNIMARDEEREKKGVVVVNLKDKKEEADAREAVKMYGQSPLSLKPRDENSPTTRRRSKKSTKDLEKGSSIPSNEDKRSAESPSDVLTDISNTETEAIKERVQKEIKEETMSKALKDAVKYDDHEIAHILLEKCFKSNTLLRSRDTHSVLYEYVMKNNGILTSYIAKAFDKTCISEENPWDELLKIALERGCKQEVLSAINTLWKGNRATNTKELLSRYERIIKEIRGRTSNDLVCLYTVVTLKLLDCDQEIMKRLQHCSLEPDKLNKFRNDISSRSDQTHSFNALLSERSTPEEFCSWHKKLTKFSSSKSSSFEEKYSESELYSILEQTDENLRAESGEVLHAVEEFVKNLAKELGAKFSIFKCDPHLVGSAADSSYVQIPVESDYLIILNELEKYFIASPVDDNFIFYLKDNSSPNGLQHLLGEHKGKHFLDPSLLRQELYKEINNILKEDGSLWKPLMKEGNAANTTNLCQDPRLTIEPTGYFTEKSKFSTIHLTWRGLTIKHLNHAIDIVPAFTPQDSPKLRDHSHLPEEYYSNMVVYPYSLKKDFASLENSKIKDLAENIHKGYKLAKFARRSFIFDEIEHLRHVDDFGNLLPTYYLKTTLLFIIENPQDITKNDSHIAWSIKIYEKLREFLTQDERIPHFFLNSSNEKDKECIFQLDKQQYCVGVRQRETMLIAIKRILDVLTRCDRIQSDISLTDFVVNGSKKWMERTSHKLSGLYFWPRLIDREIWHCTDFGFKVYNLAMMKQRYITFGESSVYDVAYLTRGRVVVATRHGLYHMSVRGDGKHRTAQGEFIAVAAHADLVYAVGHSPLSVYIYNPRKDWDEEQCIALSQIPMLFVTLSVNDTSIFVCSGIAKTIEVLSLNGKPQHTIDLSAMKQPSLCHVDNRGILLISDSRDHSLQVRDKAGKFTVVNMEPQPDGLFDAICHSGTLYIYSYTKRSGILLTKFEMAENS